MKRFVEPNHTLSAPDSVPEIALENAAVRAKAAQQGCKCGWTGEQSDWLCPQCGDCCDVVTPNAQVNARAGFMARRVEPVVSTEPKP